MSNPRQMPPRALRAALAAGALIGALVLPSVASAETTPTTPTTPTPAPSTPPPAPAPPAAGQMKLSLQGVRGNPAFAITGQRMVVQGVVDPYVGGQTVKVSFYVEGRKVAVKRVTILAGANGTGTFRFGYASAVSGLVQARVAHYATPEQVAFSGRAPALRYVNPGVTPGSSSQSVRTMQSELWHLHFAVPLSGTFDEATGRALIAYRKVVGLAREPLAGRRVFQLLQRGAGTFHVRYRSDGRHVEGDLTKQVLVEVEPGGRVHEIYTMSSGKPSTPTVIGRFRVYMKDWGTNSEGMVDSNYFIRGYAIHGYAEVPTYAASHGCLRVPIPDAATIYAWVHEGTPVDVYNESGQGSSTVRGNAGP